MVRINLVDETSAACGLSLTLTLFGPVAPRLPQPRRVGDILCVQGLPIKEMKDSKLWGTVNIAKNIRIALFSGSQSDTPGVVAYANFPIDKGPPIFVESEERVRIVELRNWFNTLTRPPIASEYIKRLDQVSEQSAKVDLICKVMSNPEEVTVEGGRRVWQFQVWDGTSVMNSPLRETEGSNLLGSVVPVRIIALESDVVRRVAHGLHEGDFIWLRNVDAITRAEARPVLRLEVSSRSSILMLSPSSIEVKELLRAYEQRLERFNAEQEAQQQKAQQERQYITEVLQELDRTPDLLGSAPVLTSAKHAEAPFTSLLRVKNCKENSKFRVRGRAIQICPSRAEDLVRRRCTSCRHEQTLSEDKACVQCGGVMFDLFYMARLLIYDGTCLLPILIYDTDARNFFYGVEPSDVRVNTGTKQALMTKLASLNPDAIVEACVYSYRPAGSSVWRYRMFDTALL